MTAPTGGSNSTFGLIALLTALSFVGPALAQDADHPLTGEEFDALTVGRTMFYNEGGQSYGVEQYLTGRRVLWAFVGDQCRKGYWYEQEELICFVYEDDPTPQCWTFYNTPDGLTARFFGDPDDTPLVAVEESTEPLPCSAPNLNV